MKPYVITEDVPFLIRQWAQEQNFTAPQPEYFAALQQRLVDQLENIFGRQNVIFISCSDLQAKMNAAVASIQGTTVVSIDTVYNSAPYHLESNRVADASTCRVLGETNRPGWPTLSEQIRALPNGLSVTLVDDGCYSGETLLRIYRLFCAHGQNVTNVLVGLSIAKRGNVLLREVPDVQFHAIYAFDEVIDWVCERDFYLGVPLSGRTAGYQQGATLRACEPAVALPYCLPFGDPISGASIPTGEVVRFSRLCLELSCEMWEEIERLSSRPVLCTDIPRLPRYVPREATRFVNALRAKWDALVL